MKYVFYVMCISTICASCFGEQVTVVRAANGDRFSGVKNCTEHHGANTSTIHTCLCQNSAANAGTFFTSCLYGENIALQTECSLSLDEVSSGYLGTASDLSGKNILQNGIPLLQQENCTKLEISTIDAWSYHNQWDTFLHSLQQVVIDSIQKTFQLAWSFQPDQNVWKNFKGQLLRLSMVCTKVENTGVKQEKECMIIKVSGTKVYSIASPVFPSKTTTSAATTSAATTSAATTLAATTSAATTSAATTLESTTSTTTSTTTSAATTLKTTQSTTLSSSSTAHQWSSTVTTANFSTVTTDTTHTTQSINNNQTIITTQYTSTKNASTDLDEAPKHEESTSNLDIIAGSVGGGVLFLLITIALIIVCRKKNGCRKMFRKEIKQVVEKPVTIANHNRQSKKNDNDNDEYMEPINWHQPKEFFVQVASDQDTKSKDKDHKQNDHVITIIPNTNSIEVNQNACTSPTKTPAKAKLPSYEPHSATPQGTGQSQEDRNKKRISVPIIPVTQSADTEILKPVAQPRKPKLEAKGSYDNPNQTMPKQELPDPRYLLKRRISSTPVLNTDNNNKDHYVTLSKAAIVGGKGSYDPRELNTMPSNTSENSEWGDDFNDDSESVTAFGPYSEVADQDYYNQRPPRKQSSNVSHNCDDQLNLQNLSVQKSDKKPKNNPNYQHLKSVKRHMQEAGTYATLAKEF